MWFRQRTFVVPRLGALAAGLLCLFGLQPPPVLADPPPQVFCRSRERMLGAVGDSCILNAQSFAHFGTLPEL